MAGGVGAAGAVSRADRVRDAVLARIVFMPDEESLKAEEEVATADAAAAVMERALLPGDPEWDPWAGDPDSGAPDGADGWMALLPAALLADCRSALAEPAGPELFKAGFWDRAVGEGAGFGCGGAADRMAPGPVLARLAQDASDAGLGTLADDELIGVMRAARRLSSWAAALEMSAVSDLMRRRLAEEADGQPGVAEHAADELAAALTLTGRGAGLLADRAMGLARLPATMRALAAGDIDVSRAAVIADEVVGLSDLHAAAVELAVIHEAPGQTTGELRAAVRRAVIAADPEAARARKERAQRDARVERWDEPAGTSALAGRDLPAAGVIAADHHLSALARGLRAAGVEGSLDNLRSRVFLALLAGQPPEAILPWWSRDTGADAAEAGGCAWAAAAGADAAGAGAAGAGPDAAGNVGAGADGEGASDAGAAGPGAAGPGAAEAGAAAGAWDGLAGAGDPGSASRWASVLPSARDALLGAVNLTVPLATWLGLAGSPGEVAGHGPLDAADTRALLARIARHPGSTWCLTATGPDGHAVAHGCARAGPGTGDPAGWLAGVRLRDLAVGTCGHERETPAYRPPPSLRHLISVRQTTCAFPGCRRPAVRCDLDHTRAYERGGRTCECNLAPLCRRHHRAKQAYGWRIDQPQPGVMVWTLPSGRSYTVRPAIYPNE